MANRYWVGGTASWDGTAGTKWAATSNGSGGETVPTSADDVFFDASSTGTVTIAAGNTGAKSINCTGFTGTITGTAAITVAGSITLVSGMTYTHTDTVTISGTGTLTTAGKTFSGLTINGSGITVTLGDALNVSTARSVTITQGTFDTANYNVTALQLVSSNSNTRTINLGSSTVTLAASGASINFVTGTNLTFNAGTSQVNLPATSAGIFGTQTYYNVSFTGSGAGTRTINAANTFNNLTLTASSTGLSELSVSANQTINGTFTCAGTTVTQRGFVRSNTIGTSRTITAATISANDCDFRDITIAGGAAGSSPTRAGDCGGNSGITFPSAKTVYRVGTNTNWTTAASWAPSSGGTGASENFPLPQDTAVINNDTTLTGTLSLNGTYNVGTLDASARTTGITLSFAGNTYYGNFTLASGVTVSGTGIQTFSGRGTQTFTSAGKTITFPITVDKPAGTFELGDAFASSNTVTHTRGTLDAKNYAVTCTQFNSSNSNTRTVTMGSGLWTLSGTGNVWTLTTATGLTFNKGSADVLLSNTSTTSRGFSGGGQSYNKLTIGGPSGSSLTAINQVNTFTELASTKTVAHTIQFSANQTITTWTATGTSGNVVTVNSSSAGTRRTITLTNSTAGTVDYMSVTDIGITNANRFYVGTNSTNGGNNLNVIFAAGPSPSTGNMFFMFQ
jgi:hypothetical protein